MGVMRAPGAGAGMKPVFMTKERRAEEALRKREVRQVKLQCLRIRILVYTPDSGRDRVDSVDCTESTYDVCMNSATHQEEQLAVKAKRDQELAALRASSGSHGAGGFGGGGPVASTSRQATNVETLKEGREQERERAAIRNMYLNGGHDKSDLYSKKKSFKAKDRMRFNFDWDADDDTSRDYNPLYNDTQEAALMFGRGTRGGIDRAQQRDAYVNRDGDRDRDDGRHRERGRYSGRDAFSSRERERERERDRWDRGIHGRRGEHERIESGEMARRGGHSDRHELSRIDHWSSKSDPSDMTERDWRIFREDHNISYRSGGNIPMPIRNWNEASALLPDAIMQAVKAANYAKPSPIQMASIPIGLMGRDCIGVAETGSGKTCAFVLPMLTYISKQPPMDTPQREAEGPYAIVMAPTRELTQQIEEETVKFCRFMRYRVVSVVGGQSIEDQGFKLRKGCEIVIATPGRMNDCLERRYAVLNQCNYVVLDEADRMIDLGFEPQINGVLDAMPSSNLKPDSSASLAGRSTADAAAASGSMQNSRRINFTRADSMNPEDSINKHYTYRTTYMFSATMPPAVERLARKYMRRPVTVVIGSVGKATDNITQQIFMVKENMKEGYLTEALDGLQNDRSLAIVFVNSKRNCDHLHRVLDRKGYSVTTLHGGKAQDQREAALDGFKQHRFNVLVATDVAGRGIDVSDVALVVNYDMPDNIENYTHRIGRTGRAGRKGVACSFVTPSDENIYYDLHNMLTESGQAIPRELARHEASRNKPGAIKPMKMM